jgi:putative SOS response-associated peptidase YedK
MCGRFSLFEPPDRVEERFDASFEYPYERRYNAAPGQALPVITDEQPEAIQAFEWGLVPLWADERDDVGTLINARSETAAEKPSFRASMAGVEAGTAETAEAAGRCLVLADGFYEWGETDEGRRPFRVTRTDEAPFAMAGLWTRWRPATTQTGLDAFGEAEAEDEPDLVETFAILTTAANETVGEIHDRMPVILAPEDESRWLTAPTADASDLLAPAPDEWLRAYRVSRAVNDASNDRPGVVEAVDTPG